MSEIERLRRLINELSDDDKQVTKQLLESRAMNPLPLQLIEQRYVRSKELTAAYARLASQLRDAELQAGPQNSG